jgi:hypothetical protein
MAGIRRARVTATEFVCVHGEAGFAALIVANRA